MTDPKYDLHCHSNYSDGSLSPTELVLRAKEQGVSTLALTDHDTVQGLFEAQQAAEQQAINFIPGIELSCLWNKKTFHVLGLNIDANNAELLAGTDQLQIIRLERAKKIATKLEKNKIPGAFEAVQNAAGAGMITRPHFANFLINQGHVSTMQSAFDHYLGQGKPAFVNTQWVELEDAVHSTLISTPLMWFHNNYYILPILPIINVDIQIAICLFFLLSKCHTQFFIIVINTYHFLYKTHRGIWRYRNRA